MNVRADSLEGKLKRGVVGRLGGWCALGAGATAGSVLGGQAELGVRLRGRLCSVKEAASELLVLCAELAIFSSQLLNVGTQCSQLRKYGGQSCILGLT